MNETLQQIQMNINAAVAANKAPAPSPSNPVPFATIEWDQSIEITRIDGFESTPGKWNVHKMCPPLSNPYTAHPFKEVVMEACQMPAGWNPQTLKNELARAGWELIETNGFFRAWKNGKKRVRNAKDIIYRRKTLEKNPPFGLSMVEIRNLNLEYYL